MGQLERWFDRLNDKPGLDSATRRGLALLLQKLDRVPANRSRTHAYRIKEKHIDELCARVKTVTPRYGGSLYVGMRPPNGQAGKIRQLRSEEEVATELGLEALSEGRSNFGYDSEEGGHSNCPEHRDLNRLNCLQLL